MCLSSGCNLQSAYRNPDLLLPQHWSRADKNTSETTQSDHNHNEPSSATAHWWKTLKDPAIDDLMAATYASNPTLEQALARMDEAQADLAVNKSAMFPSLSASTDASTANTHISGGNSSGGGSVGSGQIAGRSSTGSAGVSLHWELDLFGRIRNSVRAARNHLDARTADAESTRLTLSAKVADTVLDIRACRLVEQSLTQDVASYHKTLELIRLKKAVGLAADVDEASAQRNVATAQVSLTSQHEICQQQLNALVAISGKSREMVDEQLAKPLANGVAMPAVPEATLEIPATLLRLHPTLKSADKDAQAAWADIGVARAQRLPKIDLAAALSGEWIRSAGSTINLLTWTLAPSAAVDVLDGGKGAANVSAAEARYRQAAAFLQTNVRSVIEEVENALAAEQSAQERKTSTQLALSAAQTAFAAKEKQWKSGTINLLELEDARRQLTLAANNATSADRDRAKAWVNLVKATGNSLTHLENETYGTSPPPQTVE
ncbi:MAG: efflux transporter outer membrane subunit [Alphaproteobacteria bacterium]|nr:efflux transporter outer membrane subunit [Alphaproteobacteria bacterium]